jgi:hypothetical protein
MSVVHMAIALNVLSAPVLIFAFLTWRRVRAGLALVCLAASTLLIAILAGAGSPWQIGAAVSLCAALLLWRVQANRSAPRPRDTGMKAGRRT